MHIKVHNTFINAYKTFIHMHIKTVTHSIYKKHFISCFSWIRGRIVKHVGMDSDHLSFYTPCEPLNKFLILLKSLFPFSFLFLKWS